MGPHRRHRSSLEGDIDLSESTWRPLNPVERGKAKAAFYDIRRTKLVRLTYEYSRSDDPRCPFLQEFLRFVNISIDDSINFDDKATVDKIRSGLNSFADFLLNNFFLPLKASATKTPQPSPAGSSQAPSRHSTLESRERVASLRRDCLIRDRHRCVISRNFDLIEADRRYENSGDDFALDDEGQLLIDQDPDSFAELEVAHILPHSLNTTTANPELNKSKAIALEILDMFDNGIVYLIGGPDIDRPLNALTLRIDLHRQFGNFKISFEAMPEPMHGPHTYQIDSTQRRGLRKTMFPVTRQLHLTPERTIEPPHPRLLAVHRAICLILQLSAAGNYIDRILRDMDDGAVEADGSTHLASLVRLKLDGWWDGTVMG
ncbi:HNHc domain-containing protein [Fusarium sp. Ph1]|nr:HNHc domain-containing protein [Fusarium sp. Ph1]